MDTHISRHRMRLAEEAGKRLDLRLHFRGRPGRFRWGWRVLLVVLATGLSWPSGSLAQTVSGGDDARTIAAHLADGEFPLAIQRVSLLPPSERDQWLSEIARQQYSSGAIRGAFFTAQQIEQVDRRSGALDQLYQSRYGEPAGNAGGVGGGVGPVGAAGGVTLQDFTPLIQLIQNTISPDSWQDTGQGLGTIQAYPSGVFVSADGTLNRIRTDQSRAAQRLRERAVQDRGNRQPTTPSELRMVSLTRLEAAAEWRAAQGLPPDPMMENLAGIYAIEFLTVFPESGDVVIAGPAGDWELGPQRRPVNVDTGWPVLQLDDLVVCLRNARFENGQFGCSINPREANLRATQQYLEEQPMTGADWANGLRKALGQQDIEVFGIEPDTHAAGVLVEADYRMKLIGMGLEPTIPDVPSYFDRLATRTDEGSSDLVRWWFTMNYDDVVADPDRTLFALEGTGVKVLSENEFLNQQGERVHTGKSNPETAGFARDFTAHFDQLAAEYPVYRQLKNVFDLALVAGLIERYSLDDRVDWEAGFFVSRDPGRLHYRVRRAEAARQVESVVNDTVLKERRKRSTVKRRIVGVSGGIQFDASTVLATPLRTDDQDELSRRRGEQAPRLEVGQWWWDG